MCRLLGYLGEPILLESILTQPKHSLIVQSYQPQEMQESLLNADGFGLGWYDTQKQTSPFTYKNTQPIWNDINLKSLSGYIESGCILGYVRSATLGQGIDISNCQPFNYKNILFIHNGYIDQFRSTLYKPIRDSLQDIPYLLINGNTDSEHIFALLINEILEIIKYDFQEALHNILMFLKKIAQENKVKFLANTIITDGHQLVASRFAQDASSPSLYWLKNSSKFPNSVIIASEPLFADDWQKFPEQSITKVSENLDIQIYQI
ncbi:MAG: ergothioneine biosynthesis protein EgtC [Trichodesmium sp. St16_bin4-tuft]|nr:ergothioneine biosynthesis protein EgtC [Trichodesmium sp. MAG_R01]MDE5072233.1 ergothioneine biosynthesis protein EgtC [Trichodesmium sp. St5_bin8]MDE5077934.1 ergothioneine biosynthesis protein EgtC [Trichodesmium sp. St2_bin6]MDE5092102.1 ergothioneine biosynthesis protein EgtC [Trichodesmium sp. St18_bin3_1_1]MDE5098364.1 ergothioneine biosynthesis protein EgtC [Trichodesmium sp. St16_bin4-tuft]MDE5105092.1 ergothioneine biosynthesis protein EgtC [Trichodesmium sp. St19_bin2]